jgi:hypothetical protein
LKPNAAEMLREKNREIENAERERKGSGGGSELRRKRKKKGERNEK